MTYNPYNQNPAAPAPAGYAPAPVGYAPPAAPYQAPAAYAPPPAAPAYGEAPAYVPAGFDDAKPFGDRAEYLGPGLHQLEIRRAKLHASRKGPVFFILEMKVLATTSMPGDPVSTVHHEGEDVSLSMNLNGDYAGEIKTVLAQLLGGNANDVKSHHIQWACGEDNPFGGTIVEAAGRTRVDPKTGAVRASVKTGKPYVNFKFRVLQPGAKLAAFQAAAAQ